MPLEKRYIRDGRQRILGSVTSGFSDESSVVRDEDGHMLGRTSRYDPRCARQRGFHRHE